MKRPKKITPAAKKTSTALIAAAIRSIGARATFPRIRVLALLREAPSPLCHADIEAMLAGDNEKMDRVTIYRVLDWLHEAGFAHKAADARGVFCYMAAGVPGNHARHVHFRCLACGGVYCLDAPAPAPPRLPSGFHLTRVNLDIQGECGRCSGARS